NPNWKLHIDETSEAHWKRASPKGTPLNEAGVDSYLKAERARRKQVPTADARLKNLTRGQQTDVTVSQFQDFFASEWFDTVDENRSGALTFVEFTRATKYLTAATEFCALAAADGLVTLADIRDPEMMEAKAPALKIQLLRSATQLRIIVSPEMRVP